MTLWNDDHYAVVVGIQRYPLWPGKQLKGPVNDANTFYNWLIEEGKVPERNIKRMISDLDKKKDKTEVRLIQENIKPTKESIEEAFGEVLRQAYKPDGWWGKRLYIFLAGHGFSDYDFDLEIKEGKEMFVETALLTAEARENDKTRHFCGSSWANGLMLYGCFQEVILIMDCCRSSEGFRAVSINKFPQKPFGLNLHPLPPSSRPRFFSGYAVYPGNMAYETTRGHFSVALMQVLKSFCRRKVKKVLATTIQRQVVKTMRKRQRPDPDINVPKDFFFLS